MCLFQSDMFLSSIYIYIMLKRNNLRHKLNLPFIMSVDVEEKKLQ